MTRVKIFRKPFYLFLKYTVGVWFRINYPVTLTNPEIFKTIKPPYLLLPNHTMKWDAVLLNILFPEPIHCMASESHFRKPFIGFLFSLLGVFPKAKAKNDLGAIKHMMDLKTREKIICVYPEGQMSWDGGGLPLIYSTSKLVKLLKIPVYIPVMTGGSAVFPRWGRSKRNGPMEMTIHTLFENAAEIKKMTADEIFDRMTRMINYRDMDDSIRNKGWTYKSGSRAEYLEGILFICPSCRAIATLRSQEDELTCSACGQGGRLDEHYRFQYETPDESRPGSPLEWNLWQEKTLPLLLEEYKEENSTRPFMVDHDITIKTGHRMDPLQIWTKKGEMAVFRDHIMLRPEKGDIRLIPFEEMSGVHVMTRQKLEFYHDRTLYVFFFKDLRVSGYKWLCVLRKLGVPSSYAWHNEEVERI